MSPYPPLPTNISSPQGIAIYMNSATNSFAWTGVLFAVFVIILIGLSYRVNSKDAFVTSAFFSMILSILMRALNLIPEYIMNIFIVLSILGVALIMIRGSAEY